MRPNLLEDRSGGGDFGIEDRQFNDGEVEILLIDLDRQDKIAAEYYRQREACLREIKDSRASINKVCTRSYL